MVFCKRRPVPGDVVVWGCTGWCPCRQQNQPGMEAKHDPTVDPCIVGVAEKVEDVAFGTVQVTFKEGGTSTCHQVKDVVLPWPAAGMRRVILIEEPGDRVPPE